MDTCCRIFKLTIPLSHRHLHLIIPSKNFFGCFARFYFFPSTQSQVRIPRLNYFKKGQILRDGDKGTCLADSVAVDLILEISWVSTSAWVCAPSLQLPFLNLCSSIPVGSAGVAAPTAVFLCPAQPPWGLWMLQPGARHGGERWGVAMFTL